MAIQETYNIHSSWVLAMILVIVFFGACLMVMVVPSVWVKLVLCFALLVALVAYLRRYAFLTASSSVKRLVFDGCGCLLAFVDGNEYRGIVEGSSVVSKFMVIINIGSARFAKSHSVVIMPDSMDKNSFRRLKRLLLTLRFNRQVSRGK